MSSNSWDAVRSFAPEKTLIGRRDLGALWIKKRSRLPGGLKYLVGMLADFAPGESAHDGDVAYYEKYKRLGSLVVENKGHLIAAGRDGDHHIKLGSKRVLELHVEPGKTSFRSGLQQAAAYVDTHERFESKDYITGVTYEELGKLFCTLGFRKMDITYFQEDGMYDRQAAHMAFCAANGIEGREFKPSMIYLPINDFVQKFGA